MKKGTFTISWQTIVALLFVFAAMIFMYLILSNKLSIFKTLG